MEKKEASGNRHEVIALILGATAIFLILSLISFRNNDPTIFSSYPHGTAVKNLVGLIGSSIAWVLILLFGVSAYLIPCFIFVFVFRILSGHLHRSNISLFTSCILLIVASTGIIALYFPSHQFLGQRFLGGGLLGRQLSEFLLTYFNRIGAILVLSLLLLLGLLTMGNFSFVETGVKLIERIRQIFHFIQRNKPSEKKPPFQITTLEKTFQNKTGPSGTNKTKSNRKEKSPEKSTPAIQSVDRKDSFSLPPVELLDDYPQHPNKIGPKEMTKNAKILEEKLADFGVYGKVIEVCPGPVVTMYEYRPAAGIKISRIVGLADDLAMALRALSVRVIAPLPGKAVIGIEIPNQNREIVSLKELVSSSEFFKSSSPLSFVLGKDIMGRIVMANLARMPHLLIAGATGTGKSVCINTILASLLFRSYPINLRLLLIDPKRIELNCYEGIPHLLHPVVTDAKKATNVLRWAVAEMEHRYELLADLGVRNIDNYNKAIAQGIFQNDGDKNGENPDLVHQNLSYIVIIIDELSDLMMVASREVEELIIRLAQMARAAGIHLILATQRPSVDVITGLIKANIPSRISFQVSSRTDSRTVLDTNGAETLLGNGDMLFLPPGTAKLQRIHGAFISEKEIKRLTHFLKKQSQPQYNTTIGDFSQKSEEDGEKEFEIDEKYEQALEIVRQTRQASISMLQRRLRVGYNRAARMIEMMEREGIVGPSDGSKAREVYLPPR